MTLIHSGLISTLSYLALRPQGLQLPGTKMMQTMLVLLVVLQDFVLSLSHELFQDVFAIDVVSHSKVLFVMAKMMLTARIVVPKRSHLE